MSSPRYPKEPVVPVPESILRLAEGGTVPGLACNLRPSQQPTLSGDGLVAQRLVEFLQVRHERIYQSMAVCLHSITLPCKVLLSYQGFGKSDVWVAYVELTAIHWTEDHYPRLDFIHPDAREPVSLWAGLLLAIVPVPESPREICFAHPDDAPGQAGQHFVRLATQLTTPTTPPGVQA